MMNAAANIAASASTAPITAYRRASDMLFFPPEGIDTRRVYRQGCSGSIPRIWVSDSPALGPAAAAVAGRSGVSAAMPVSCGPSNAATSTAASAPAPKPATTIHRAANSRAIISISFVFQRGPFRTSASERPSETARPLPLYQSCVDARVVGFRTSAELFVVRRVAVRSSVLTPFSRTCGRVHRDDQPLFRGEFGPIARLWRYHDHRWSDRYTGAPRPRTGIGRRWEWVVVQPTVTTGLLEREREIAALRQAWRRAEAGRGSGWLICAEAGGGKSRLLREVTRGLPLGRGACEPVIPPEPYLAVM